LFGSGLGVKKECIGLACAVIHESYHVEGDRLVAVWGFEGGTVSLGYMTIKQDTADDTPNGRRVAASLSCAVNGKDFAVFVKFVRDTKEGFEFVFAFLQGGGHDKGNVLVDPKLPTGYGCKGW
jgi:hypothetical protein